VEARSQLAATMSESASASPTEKAMSADPWDAPYFGAPTYFTYLASLPPLPEPVTMPAASTFAAASAVRLAFPFFGAPTYDGFPAFGADSAVSGQADRPLLPADPWDAPYFGAPVYLSYDPTHVPSRPEQPSPARIVEPAGSSPVVAASPPALASAAAATVASPPASGAPAPPPPRQGWLARLFGRSPRT
jgi:hypothetical protein